MCLRWDTQYKLFLVVDIKISESAVECCPTNAEQSGGDLIAAGVFEAVITNAAE